MFFLSCQLTGPDNASNSLKKQADLLHVESISPATNPLSTYNDAMLTPCESISTRKDPTATQRDSAATQNDPTSVKNDSISIEIDLNTPPNVSL